MSHEIVCWKCGASLAVLSLPFGRSDRCKACGVDVHVCRLCVNFDPRAYQQCREQNIEEVRDKERANFCDYFKPKAGAFQDSGALSAAQAARAELEKLFGK
jgi:hypothetical protein